MVNCNCSEELATGIKECSSFNPMLNNPYYINKAAIKMAQLESTCTLQNKMNNVLDHLNNKALTRLQF